MSKKSFFSKKQREYIEAIVYILAIIIVIFCKVYGTIYFSLIPLLVILGIVGKVLFNRGVVTTVFGILVSVCMVYTKGDMEILENIIYSSLVGLDIAMDELLEEYLKKAYLLLKKKKSKTKKIRKKDLKIYTSLIIICIVTFIVNGYTNGNILSYEKCKASLLKYINENYMSKDDFRIVNVTYAVGLNPNYSFNVYNSQEDHISKFVVYLKNTNIVEDEYKDTILAKNNSIKNKELKEYLDNNSFSKKYGDIDISLKILDKENIEIELNKSVEILNDIEKEVFAKQVVEFLEDIKGYKDYAILQDLLISISNKNDEKDIVISNIYIEGYNKNIVNSNEEPFKYILKSLSIEYIDSK